ncbi:MAG: hypothetical protein V8Q40_04775 [Anaerosacchariphilus sp.]
MSAAQKVDDKQKTALLNDKAVESIRKLDGVEAVTPVEQMIGYLKSGSYIGMIKLYGIDLDTARASRLPRRKEKRRRKACGFTRSSWLVTTWPEASVIRIITGPTRWTRTVIPWWT